ncbi:MAG: hypothetical protein COX02_00845 [Candidatus Vogelbacteria bacterium CG22_combo_CG10-13_8_21_14_all_37_9]|uniref:AAA+ ATPase domain-containing protein n=1 Tax=Candidatus Vogelbacteria bacterium CG22_combo_CG10-13_8_21_14_all_37_9 TaxID=1975046 RepID=A0A2H0BKW2_9BACT|nr:MAG: hypothetical protein BK005_00735 [bacterium CG10_37_50]PIP58317.1 MAG: hypothetical protein COX02_00845 [Candidatus Vogelbacteria bacterium CG22_combo_CG10-13_8_21_14_all_37_9]
MSDLSNNIYQEILAEKNVLLVGPTDSGKTWYVKNILIPFLQEKKIKVIYCSDPDFIPKQINEIDVLIVDEIETLLDQDFLEADSSNSKPYYSKEYLNKVRSWHDKLKEIMIPSVFILTRNSHGEIKNIIDNHSEMDWGVKVECFIFEKKV